MLYNFKIILVCAAVSLVSYNIFSSGNYKLETQELLAKWFDAAQTGEVEIIRQYISKTDINSCDINGNTALILAAYRGRVDIIKLLLNQPGIKICVKNRYGCTALIIADNKESELLIQNKIKELKNSAFKAIESNNINHLKSIITQIGIDHADKDGNNFLHQAFSINSPEIVSFLLQNCENPAELLALKNKKGQFPLELISPSSALFEYFINLAFCS